MNMASTLALAFGIFAGGVASAQDFDPTAQMRRNRGVTDGFARVQSNFSISIPFKEQQESIDQHEAALRSFYKLAAGSCRMVVETIADNCEVINVTSNVNTRERGQTGSLITVSGQITMQVKFKAEVSKTEP